MILIPMTAISTLFVKIPRAHIPARVKLDIQETDGPVLVRRDIN